MTRAELTPLSIKPALQSSTELGAADRSARLVDSPAVHKPAAVCSATAGDLADTPVRPDLEQRSVDSSDGSLSLDKAGQDGRFESILYQAGTTIGVREPPGYFRDLNLDQIVKAVTTGHDEYDLKPFFHDPLKSVEAIQYRHEILQDLEREGLLDCVKEFVAAMRSMRQKLVQADKLHYKYQKERWFLHAVETYCNAISGLHNEMSELHLASRGFARFRRYVSTYVKSDRFLVLTAAVSKLNRDLAAIRYTVLIKGNGFKVRRYNAEQDYSQKVTETFQKFRQSADSDYRVDFKEYADMNHIEAQVLDFVARLYPETFSELENFVGSNRDYADPTITAFDREVHFYTAYLDYIASFKRARLSFCYPTVSETTKEIGDEGAFDLALAAKLLPAKTPIVCNDFSLTGKERILVVSGPNQGGKTTFARTFGQLHYLASIGCLVPGSAARLFLFDRMFTHFEREENIDNLRGKLQDDLVRIHEILETATPQSIIIMNEIFNSTTLKDAVFLARKVMDKVIELDALCVCVSFLEELASLSEKTVSMVSAVVPDNPALRTFKVIRRPADGQSFAISIAEKYRLTYDCLKTRLRL